MHSKSLADIKAIRDPIVKANGLVKRLFACSKMSGTVELSSAAICPCKKEKKNKDENVDQISSFSRVND